MKEEKRKDRDLTLKALESDDLDLDIEEIALVTQRLKNSSRRPEGTLRKEVLASHRTVIMISIRGALDVENTITL